MIKQIKLPTGLTLLSKHIPATAAVTVLILARTGSRNETRDHRGLAHFQEHMFFKGGEKYRTAREVSAAIDSVGGEFNAFTAKEYVGYYVKVDGTHIDLALDVLSDMMLKAKFDENEINKERGVILEEYAMYQDTPMYQVGWEFESLLFGDQPLGWDQIGTAETIKSISQKDFMNFKNTWYQPGNLAVSVAGAFDDEALPGKIAKYFPFSGDKKAPAWVKFLRPGDKRRLHLIKKKTEQTHFVLGTYGFTYSDKLSRAAMLLSIILGGNMSSRLFSKIREERGYAYYVGCHSDNFTDTGSFYARSGVNVGKARESASLVIEEFKEVLANGVTEEEIVRAKEFAKGHMTLAHEDSEHVANSVGRRFFFDEKLVELDERKRLIDAVTLDDISQTAKILFEEDMFLSVIGPHDEKDFEGLV